MKRLPANHEKVEVVPSGSIRGDKAGSGQATGGRVYQGDLVPGVAFQCGTCPEKER